jgi:hypothetical protein
MVVAVVRKESEEFEARMRMRRRRAEGGEEGFEMREAGGDF